MNLIACFQFFGLKNGGAKTKAIMKFSNIILLVFLICLSSKSYSQNVTLSVKDAPLVKVFKEITKQTGYKFVYTESLLQKAEKVTVTINNATLTEALDECFKNQVITYSILNKLIVIKEKAKAGQKQELSASSSLINLQGTVTDSKGNPAVGVTVAVKGGKAATSTSTAGTFTINAAEGSTLVFSSVGFETLQKVVGKDVLLNVALTEKVGTSEEVVVIGYGTAKKRDLTGSVSSLSSEEITKSKATGTQEAMQGRVAGVDIKRSSGKPGADFNIEIRGANSITGSTAPLYVIDGIAVAQLGYATNPINDINPADIERIDVLKDASSTAIYGSRGANGVILVTTKRGSKGATKIVYDGYVGIVNPTHIPPVMNGPTFVNYARDFYNALSNYPTTPVADNKIFSATELTNIANGTYTNWIDIIKRNGMQSNHNLSITGGDEKTTYFVSGGFQDYQGTTKVENTKKYTLKAGLDKNISKAIKAGASLYTTFADIHPGSGEVFRSAYRLRPTGSAYNADGSQKFFAYESEAQITNPLFDLDNEIRQQQYIHILPNIYAEATLAKGLKIRSSFSPDITFQRIGQYDDTYTKQQAGTKPSSASDGSNQWVNYSLDNLLTYNKDIGKGKLDIAVGNTYEYHQQDYSTIAVQGLPYRSLWYNLGTATTVTINGVAVAPTTAVTSGYSKQTLVGYYGRVNYNFDGKYLLTATFRADGNSVFSVDHKWGYFPSAAFAWIINQEDFMKNVKAIDLLKLRLSTGKSGNASSVVPYGTQASIYQTPYDFNGVAASGFAPNFGNQNLTWEKTTEYNAGFDLSLLKNRISATVDFYQKTSKGSVLLQNIPPSNGYSTTTTNLGSVRNEGVEIGLNFVNFKTQKFSWTTSFNMAFNKNKLVSLYGDGKDDIGNARFLGQKTRVLFNYKLLGVWQTSEATQAAVFGQKPGQYKIQDLNNDGKIDANDRQILGSDIPNWFGGMTNNFNFANFDLSFTVYTRQGTYQNSVFLEQALNGDQGRARFGAYDRSYWTPTNPSNTWANNAIETDATRRLVAQYQNTSYVKISNITLGYTIPRAAMNRAGIKNLRVYANAFNPFIFSKFIGWDPENPDGSSFLNQDFRTRTFMLGLNLTL